ncbi:MAG: aspartyl protease family protein [Nitrososphaerales archaeon]
MGLVKVKATIGNVKREIIKEMTFIADSGAFNTVVSPSLAKELKLETLATTKVTLANGKSAEAGISVAYIKLLDREGEFMVWIMKAPEPLLGATVFEGLGLAIDFSTGEVRHSRSFGLAAL